MTRVDGSKPCPKCAGSGDRDPVTSRESQRYIDTGIKPECRRCKGQGIIKPKVQRVARTPNWGDLTVELSSEGIRIKEKNRKKWFGPVALGVLYQQLVDAQVKADLLARKRGRGKGR